MHMVGLNLVSICSVYGLPLLMLVSETDPLHGPGRRKGLGSGHVPIYIQVVPMEWNYAWV